MNNSNYRAEVKDYVQILSIGAETYENQLIKSQATVDIARLSIACNLFHRDNGSYPKSLAELVPRYLPDLPTIAYTQEAYTYELRPHQRPLIQAVLQSDLEANSDDLYQSMLLD